MANEKRIRRNLQRTSLGASLASSGTAVKFATPGLDFSVDASHHAVLSINPTATNAELVTLITYTANATSGTLAARTGATHAAGEVVRHGPDRRDHSGIATALGATGYSLTATTWGNLATGTDRSLRAETGDIVQIIVNGLWGSEAVTGYLDACTLTSTGGTNRFVSSGATAAASAGVPGWTGVASAQSAPSAPACLTLQSTDIASGTTTVRIRARASATGGKTLTLDGGGVTLINFGPPGE